MQSESSPSGESPILIPDPEDSLPGSDTESGEEVVSPLLTRDNEPTMSSGEEGHGGGVYPPSVPNPTSMVSERMHCGGSGDTTHPSGTLRSPKGSTNVGREEPRPSLGVELELSAPGSEPTSSSIKRAERPGMPPLAEDLIEVDNPPPKKKCKRRKKRCLSPDQSVHHILDVFKTSDRYTVGSISWLWVESTNLYNK